VARCCVTTATHYPEDITLSIRQCHMLLLAYMVAGGWTPVVVLLLERQPIDNETLLVINNTALFGAIAGVDAFF